MNKGINIYNRNEIVNCLFFLLLFVTVGCCSVNKVKRNLIDYTDQDWGRDSALVKSFKYVDSIVTKAKNSKVYYCDPAILLIIEKKTAIASSGDKNFIGVRFTFEDWLKWHTWFKQFFRK